LAGVLLMAVASGMCVAVTVNINPHKIVLNAEGKADDVQANIPIVLASASITKFDVTLSFDDIEVAKAESARYCLIDNMLIIGFDRTELQDNPDVQNMANSTVTAKVEGSVTVKNADGKTETTEFSGSDKVKIVAPGKKPDKE
jgi:hypothetical protein